MKKRIMAIILCFTMVFTMTGYVGFADYTQVYAESGDLYVDETLDILSEEGVEETLGTDLSIYASLLSTGDTEEMYMLMLEYMNNDPEGLMALTTGEIEGLKVHVKALDPELDDADTQDILDTLDVILGDFDGVSTYATTNTNWSGTVNGRTINAADTLNVTLTGDVTLSGTITINGTLNITTDGNGTRAITRTNGSQFFKIQNGGRLIINGTEASPITINGYNGGSYAVFTAGKGTLNLNYVNIKNAKRGSGYTGGAIEYVNGSGDVTSNITNCTIEGCTAGEGSAIFFNNGVTGNIRLTNTTIKNCVAQNGNYGGTIRTYGNANCKLVIESCTITNNTVGTCKSASNGGGVYWNARGEKSSLTITGTAEKPTIISNNSAQNGGGIFLSGSSISIEHTVIENNTARRGGGINMQAYDVSGTSYGPGCSLVLGAGAKLVNNTATEYGGGVYMEIDDGSTTDGEDFRITINDGAVIERNTAANGGGIAVTQKINNASYTDGKGRMYDAYVNINGGTISENTATANGGAFYIDRQYSGTNASKYDLEVEVSGGRIYGNSAAANGGAIYLTDKAAGASVTVSGGFIGDDKANTAVDGGAFYIKGGSFTMSGGIVSNNQATQNGGAVYVTGGNFTMSGGTLGESNANTAVDGGAVYVSGGNFTMSGGTVSNNDATRNGGAVYVTDGNFNMTNGTIGGADATKANTAVDGGAVYLSGGNFTMSGGTVSHNKATNNGGAAYIVGGKVTMNNGNITNNEAAVDGGALYVAGTNASNEYFTMSDGNISYNKAARDGGAVYVSNGTVRMTSGVISNNEAINSNGGAFYVNGGNVWLGVNGCKYTDPNGNHTVNPTDKAHPKVIDNAAKDSGGGIAIMGAGNLTMYCGKVINNMAINPGRGLNVYMENGTFQYHTGNVGSLSDPELVIVGGKLVDNSKPNPNAMITINYYRDNTGTVSDKSAQATNGSVFNLPDGENYWDAPKINGVQYRFFGWTFNGNASDETNVRNKNQYKPLGTPIIAQEGTGDEADSNTTDNNIHLYALWAPEESKITYMGVTIVNGEYTSLPADEVAAMNEKVNNPSTYEFSVGPQLDVVNDVKKDGYTFKGWYIYQDLNQNANWGFEPAFNADNSLNYAELEFVAAGTQIDFGSTNFGNVTLIAAFEPAFADLRIAKDGWDSRDANQTFIFRITGTPDDGGAAIDMTVTIHGNGEVLIKDLPVGTYNVKEVTEWSWRYTTGEKSVKLDNPDAEKTLEFENTRFNPLWLSGDSFCDNLWSGINNSVIKRLFS